MKSGQKSFRMKIEDVVPIDLKSVWEDMEKCHKLGLTKSIGVSNFSCKKLALILSIATIPPAVNQVEMNPLWQQKKLIEFCRVNGIVMAAFSPLGANGTYWRSSNVRECKVLQEIAEAKGKTVAQLCIRWVYEQGVCVVVKSFNKERMKQNLQIFGWELSTEESKRIAQIPQRKGFSGEFFTSINGPTKSIEELCDGEI